MPPDPERLDIKDRKIAEAIVHNPNASIPLLAKLTGFPESTVSKRLAEMQQTNRLGRVIEVLDWPAIGYQRRYRIDILVDQRALTLGRGGPLRARPENEAERIDTQEKLGTYIKYTLSKKYEGRIFVLDVSMLLGHEADLSITVLARGTKAIRDFITNGLRILGGVARSSTSEEIWTCPSLPELAGVVDQMADSSPQARKT
jgi:DNA-binding Lrp family transcriptional regulator